MKEKIHGSLALLLAAGALAGGVAVLTTPNSAVAEEVPISWYWVDANWDCPANCNAQEYACPCAETVHPPPGDIA